MTDKKEEIGFHEGALATLAKEREEFLKTLKVIEQLMQLHVKALSDLGVDLSKKENQEPTKTKKKKNSKPLDEALR